MAMSTAVSSYDSCINQGQRAKVKGQKQTKK